MILALLSDGSVNLTSIRLLASHLSDENHEELLACASGRSRREVEELLARRFPSPAVPSSVRKLPEGKTTLAPGAPLPAAGVTTEPQACATTDNSPPPASAQESAPAAPAHPSHRAVVAPLATDLYKITFTANAETCRKLRQAQELLRHQIPDGNPAEVFDRALSALLQDLARKKLAVTQRPRPSQGTAPGSRHVPAAVKRAVWLRDAGRCAFVAKDGRRCREQGFLEFHHIHPHAEGGEATVSNIGLRCRPHNGHEAELYFGSRNPSGAARQLVPERARPRPPRLEKGTPVQV